MGEVKFLLSQEDIDHVAKVAGNEAVKAFVNQQKKAEKKRSRANDKIRRTKDMLKSYRRMKATLDEETEFTDEEKIELRWRFVEDLLGSADSFTEKSEHVVIDSEKKRQENLYCVHCIENAVTLYGEECEKSSNEEAKRRFRELYAMYISEDGHSVKEIAEAENVGEKTVYKDLGMATKILSVYLLGM